MRSRILGLKTILCCALTLLLPRRSPAFAGQSHTNPLNRDPLVQEAFQHFYDLDFPGALERFERVQQLHPGDPEATALLLEATLFQELYRQDLLDTTFYANDGFLTGKHATQEDPAVRNRIFALADEAVREADALLSRNPNDVDALYARGWARGLKCTYVAMVERAYGAGFRLATKAKDDEARVLQLDPNYVNAKLVVGVYTYVVGALPLPFKILIGFAGITGSKVRGHEAAVGCGQPRCGHQRGSPHRHCALPAPRSQIHSRPSRSFAALRPSTPATISSRLEEANLRKDDGEGMAAVASYRRDRRQRAKPGYYASAQLELTYFGLGDALRGQRHYADAAQAYEHAAYTQHVGPELKIRSMLDAGQCHDLIGERQQARQGLPDGHRRRPQHLASRAGQEVFE